LSRDRLHRQNLFENELEKRSAIGKLSKRPREQGKPKQHGKSQSVDPRRFSKLRLTLRKAQMVREAVKGRKRKAVVRAQLQKDQRRES